MGPRRRRALGRVGAAAPLDRRRGLVGTPRGVQGLGQQHGDLGLEALRQSHGPPEGRDGLVEAPQVRRGLCDNQISGAPNPNSLVDFRTGRCDTKRVQRADVVGARAPAPVWKSKFTARARASSSTPSTRRAPAAVYRASRRLSEECTRPRWLISTQARTARARRRRSAAGHCACAPTARASPTLSVACVQPRGTYRTSPGAWRQPPRRIAAQARIDARGWTIAAPGVDNRQIAAPGARVLDGVEPALAAGDEAERGTRLRRGRAAAGPTARARG